MAHIDPEDPIFAFSAEQARQITGLSDDRLRNLDQAGIFRPSLGEDNRRRPHSRVYSFRDVVGLRAVYLIQHQVTFAQLEALATWLREHRNCPWPELAFEVVGGQIEFFDPASNDAPVARLDPDSAHMTVRMQAVADEVTAAARGMLRRSAAEIGEVQRRRFVLHNTPVLAGTRIPTSTISSYINAGFSEDVVLKKFPSLTAADIVAAVEFDAISESRATG